MNKKLEFKHIVGGALIAGMVPFFSGCFVLSEDDDDDIVVEPEEFAAVFLWAMEERTKSVRNLEFLPEVVAKDRSKAQTHRMIRGPGGEPGLWGGVSSVPLDQINPPDGYSVVLDACGSTGVDTYSWMVDGAAYGTGNCEEEVLLHAGDHTVELTVSNEAGEMETVSETITVKDYVIVAMGDSYSSGEGNPTRWEEPFDADENPEGPKDSFWEERDAHGRGWDEGGYWDYANCHRSTRSGQAQAAIDLEQADPHTSVTFIYVACSGAQIDSGILGGKEGNLNETASGEPHVEEPQAKQAYDLVIANGREIDFLILGIGGNDVGFVPVVTECLLNADCFLSESNLDFLGNFAPGVLDEIKTALEAELAIENAKPIEPIVGDPDPDVEYKDQQRIVVLTFAIGSVEKKLADSDHLPLVPVGDNVALADLGSLVMKPDTSTLPAPAVDGGVPADYLDTAPSLGPIEDFDGVFNTVLSDVATHSCLDTFQNAMLLDGQIGPDPEPCRDFSTSEVGLAQVNACFRGDKGLDDPEVEKACKFVNTYYEFPTEELSEDGDGNPIVIEIPGRWRQMAPEASFGLGVPADRILYTEYPDLTTDGSSGEVEFCEIELNAEELTTLLETAIGLIDDPEKQAEFQVIIDLINDTPLLDQPFGLTQSEFRYASESLLGGDPDFLTGVIDPSVARVIEGLDLTTNWQVEGTDNPYNCIGPGVVAGPWTEGVGCEAADENTPEEDIVGSINLAARGPALNEAVRLSEDLYGWTAATGTFESAMGHGLCVSQPGRRDEPGEGAHAYLIGPLAGTNGSGSAHPNLLGQEDYRKAIVAAVEAAMEGMD